MDNLSVKVINSKPAQIEFNKLDMERNLKTTLEKYKGITLTDDTIKDGKKVRADLNKGKKALDEFRKKVKRELTEPIKEFEKDCKDLDKLFNEVLDPIDGQIKDFEENERKQKRLEVEKLVSVVENLFSVENLEIKKEYLNKSMSLKKVKDDLELQAKEIKENEAFKDTQIELLAAKVTAIELKEDIKLSLDKYKTMLKYEDLDTVLEHVNADVKEFTKVVEVPEKLNKPHFEEKSVFDVLSKEEEEIFRDTYVINGTDAQLTKLEQFMNELGLEWEVQ